MLIALNKHARLFAFYSVGIIACSRWLSVTPEEVLEAINTALPHFHNKANGRYEKPNKTAIYRFCIEKGLLHASTIARNSFSRMVKEYEMLKEDPSTENKRRMAFSMQYANQLWQADTMFGPMVGGKQSKLIAFIDDASRVLCHGEFFLEENTDSMIRALRAAFYKRGLPEQLLVDNGSIYCSQEITLNQWLLASFPGFGSKQ